MACQHKFQNELLLAQLNYEPTTLIVGTFNPAWPADNNARWFYGRTHDEFGNQNNNFWAVLPRLYGRESLINATPDEWKGFCRDKRIAITDLIGCIADAYESNPNHVRALRTYSDSSIAKQFNGHELVNVEQLLQHHHSIKNVYLTRGVGETFWRRVWRPVRQYAMLHGLYEQTLLTPSGYAFYQHGRYNRANPQARIAELEDFILMRWQEKWHQLNNNEA